MSNVIYGKTMENLRNGVNMRLVNNEKDHSKCTWKPEYMSHKIIDNNVVGIRKYKPTLKINKAGYIGMCILELSKILMYDFHYDYIKNKYGINSRLLITDSDGLMHEFFNVFKSMRF